MLVHGRTHRDYNLFRFIHAADIHLDSPLRGLDETAPQATIREAPRRALENLVKLCLDERVDFLIIAGDLYDGDCNDYATAHFLNAQMRRLGNIPAYIIRGNHDSASKLTNQLPLPENVRVFASKTAETMELARHRVAIHGQSFDTRAVADNLVRGFPAAKAGWYNLGMLHTSLTGNAIHPTYAPCTVEDLQAKDYHYWALGHIHTRQVVRDANPTIVFPGNVQGRHAREPGAKGAYLVAVDDAGNSTLEFRELDVVRWAIVECQVKPDDDSDAIMTQAANAACEEVDTNDGRFAVVRLEIRGKSIAHAQLLAATRKLTHELREAIKNRSNECVWLEKISFRTTAIERDEPSADVEDARAEVQAVIAELADDPVLFAEFGAAIKELTDLKARLPAGVDDDFDLANPDNLRELLNRVGPILDAAAAASGGER